MSERLSPQPDPADEFAELLSQLRPRDSSVSRDRLMFLAGRQEALRELRTFRRWRWPAATAASWLVTALIAGLWAQSRHQVQPLVVDSGTAVGRVFESPPEPALPAPNLGERERTASPENVAIVKQPSRGGRVRSSSPPRAGSLASLDGLHQLNGLPRVSAIGWLAATAGSDRTAAVQEGISPAEVEPGPPATYARLMKVYLDDPSGLAAMGGLL